MIILNVREACSNSWFLSTALEFKLHTKHRERLSTPPPKAFSGIRARLMPDFAKTAFKPIKDSGELTIPEGF